MYVYYYYFSLPMLLISNFLVLLSDNFFFMWMIMEINLMCFISMLAVYKFCYTQILMNYFLVQAFNSYLFLFSSILFSYNLMKNSMEFFIFFSMISKMGLPPFHFWYMSFMKQLNWMLFFINSSMQKFIPLVIIYLNVSKSILITCLMMMMIFLSPFLSVNFFTMKFIMCFSSFIQILWLVNLMMFNEIVWIVFFLIYNLISFSLIYVFYKFNINYLHDLSLKNLNLINYLINFMIFSLASIPPLSGFLNKLIYFKCMIYVNSMYFLVLLMLFSLMTLYFYIRIMMFNSMIFAVNVKKFNYLIKNFKMLNFSLAMMFTIFFFVLIELF
uniref:NADH dehydrogenase subunit 2 n=1 Tax=Lamennaisia ambigua TaxID=3064205 RepID=UPI00286AB7D3|nr:NADH dehydrogenase subunit 2 [Lamennaisia ambigua]WKV28898.1 NADH dehydrogenase subunit 2 [Lamennaisia ambigua]